MASSQAMFRLPSMSFATKSLATLPLAVLVYDNLLSLCRVKGKSMEPTLYDGDIVVVRKSDGLWQRWTREWPDDENEASIPNEKDGGTAHRWAIERGQVLDYEAQYCRSSPNTGWVRTPPVPITGNIVVYKDPSTYPSSLNIKRVVGLGGQTVLGNRRRIESESLSAEQSFKQENRRPWSLDEFMMGGRKVLTPCVPHYSVWVEGDNAEHSQDSRQSGAVSKKLLVGIAEYRVWPPWRIGKLDQNAPLDDVDQEIEEQEDDDREGTSNSKKLKLPNDSSGYADHS